MMIQQQMIHQIKQITLLIVLLSLGLTYPLQAQVYDSTEVPTPFFIEGERLVDGIALHWYPTSPFTWELNLQSGYQLSRVEIDSVGQLIGEPEVLADSILPQDSSWFSQNGDLFNGLMEPLGGLLYDSLFQFPENDLLNETTMKYNYLVYEATRRSEVAVALGLGFVDMEADPSKRYQYTVRTLSNTLQADVQFTQPFIVRAYSDPLYRQEFRFPGGQSFSDMLAAAFPVDLERIVATSRGYGDSLVIRWGPNSPRLWERAKENGFEVYKDTGNSDFKLLAVIKPWPESQITAAIADDSMALAAAGILYSQTDGSEQGGSVYEQNAIFENNLGFALYAAERSPLAGDILGFRYVDRDVPKDSSYTYIISTDGLENIWLTGKTSGFNTYQEVGPPSGLRTEAGDQQINLIWDKGRNQSRFSSYTVERSEDSLTYFPLTGNNIVFIETDEMPRQVYSYLDTTVKNGQTYYYRLRGFDSFGEVSMPSETEGKAFDMTPPRPVEMGFVDFDEASHKIRLAWEELGTPSADLSHYQVMMGEQSAGPFGAISQRLPVSQDSFVLDLTGMEMDRAFFFAIYSYDQSGNVNTSAVEQVVVPDKIAPLPPENLRGVVDSASFVTITWEHSVSKDVEGYWLYFGNSPDEELSPVNKQLLKTNYYVYYLDEKSLTKKAYYCVRAQDDSYNRSLASELIEVKRLDLNPPVPPYAVNALNDKLGLQLNWSLSPSEDVAGQLLYRRTEAITDTGFVLLDSLSAFQKTYLDTAVQIGETYYYMMRAWDDSGNLSEVSSETSTKVVFPGESIQVEEWMVTAATSNSVQLSWQFQPKIAQLVGLLYTYEIHRSVGGQPLRLYQELASDTVNYTDLQVEANVLYQYAIRVRFDNGWMGAFSEVKSLLTE